MQLLGICIFTLHLDFLKSQFDLEDIHLKYISDMQ